VTSYELLLLLHVVTVIIWLGAGFTMDLLFLRAERTGNPADLGKTGEFQEWLVPRLFIPFGVLTLVFGVLLVFDGPWSFDDVWIVIGLVGWIVAWGVGFLVIRPQGEKMKEIVMQHGPTSPEATARGAAAERRLARSAAGALPHRRRHGAQADVGRRVDARRAGGDLGRSGGRRRLVAAEAGSRGGAGLRAAVAHTPDAALLTAHVGASTSPAAPRQSTLWVSSSSTRCATANAALAAGTPQ